MAAGPDCPQAGPESAGVGLGRASIWTWASRRCRSGSGALVAARLGSSRRPARAPPGSIYVGNPDFAPDTVVLGAPVAAGRRGVRGVILLAEPHGREPGRGSPPRRRRPTPRRREELDEHQSGLGRAMTMTGAGGRGNCGRAACRLGPDHRRRTRGLISSSSGPRAFRGLDDCRGGRPLRPVDGGGWRSRSL
jgi:hypothetical protein